VRQRIVLWRHGRTQWNAKGLVQGQTDTELDHVGRRQARSAAARLASLVPVRIVSSDLARAHDTATVLGDMTGVAVEKDQRLREMNFGQREGKTFDEAMEQFPEQMRRWLDGDDTRFAGAETYAEAGARFSHAVEDVAGPLGDDETAVVVAHGAVLRVGICAFLGLPQEFWVKFGGFNNCSWTVLGEGRGGWRIEEWNAGSLPTPVLSDDE